MQEAFGKSIVLSIFSKYIEKQKQSVFIIDTCLENSSISTIFGKINNQNIQKISKNIHYMYYQTFEIEDNFLNLKKIIEEKKKEVDYILIDINSYINSNFYKNIANISDNIFFLIEPNLIELQKAKEILEIYKYDFKIKDEKIKIIFNKVNEFQISKDILEDVFLEYKILEYIKYNSEYTLYINKNAKHWIEEKPYEKIYKKMLK